MYRTPLRSDRNERFGYRVLVEIFAAPTRNNEKRNVRAADFSVDLYKNVTVGVSQIFLVGILRSSKIIRRPRVPATRRCAHV